MVVTARTAIATFLGTTLAGYFAVLPLFWPTPTVSVDMPVTAPADADLSIRVTASAWHSNFGIVNVRFYVDPATTPHGPGGPFYPVVLYNAARVHRWPIWSVDRMSWPRSRTLELTLPLRKLSEEGVVTPGLLRGKVDVAVEYLRSPRQWLAAWVGELYSSETTLFVPFELRLGDASSTSQKTSTSDSTP
jgi:hypothetical protein